MRKVEVSSYSEKWSFDFAEEAAKLKLIFGNEIVDIHHIGSTSVPGLKAKPIIDIMPVVQDIASLTNTIKRCKTLDINLKGRMVSLDGDTFKKVETIAPTMFIFIKLEVKKSIDI